MPTNGSDEIVQAAFRAGSRRARFLSSDQPSLPQEDPMATPRLSAPQKFHATQPSSGFPERDRLGLFPGSELLLLVEKQNRDKVDEAFSGIDFLGSAQRPAS